MRIGIDLDGVVYPYDAAFRHYVSTIGIQVPKDFVANQWQFFLDLGMTFDDYWAHHINGINAGIIFSWGNPYAKAVRAIGEMRSRGHEVFIVTDRNAGRPGYALQQTAAWLARCDITYDGITFTAKKDVVSGLDVFVDDRPENVELMERAGIHSYLLDQPWNRGAGEFKRTSDLMQFLDRIERKDHS